MTREQHIAILEFFDSIISGDLTPLDVEADAIIRAYLKRNPDAAYYLTLRAMSGLETVATPTAIKSETLRQKSRLSRIFERRQPAVT